jgi:hypothetical protein
MSYYPSFNLGGLMQTQLTRSIGAGAVALACFASAAAAQVAAPAAPAQAATANPANANIVVEKPTYTTIPIELEVSRPAAEVWKRIGKYCDISEWLQIPTGCTILSGTDGEVGAVRSVAGEVLVGKTEFSYTYTQTVRAGRPYNLYHGTLEVRPLTDKTSKIVYTLMLDVSDKADQAAKDADLAMRRMRFEAALQTMKEIAEAK